MDPGLPSPRHRGGARPVDRVGPGQRGRPGTPRAEAANDGARRGPHGGAEAAATAYLDALVSHDPSSVPLRPDATRTENGVPTGFSGPQIRRDLRDGPRYRVVQRITDTRYRLAGDTATVDYRLVAGLGVPLTTERVHETLTVPVGAIRAIVAEISPERVGS
jgi:hypothetical protein